MMVDSLLPYSIDSDIILIDDSYCIYHMSFHSDNDENKVTVSTGSPAKVHPQQNIIYDDIEIFDKETALSLEIMDIEKSTISLKYDMRAGEERKVDSTKQRCLRDLSTSELNALDRVLDLGLVSHDHFINELKDLASDDSSKEENTERAFSDLLESAKILLGFMQVLICI